MKRAIAGIVLSFSYLLVLGSLSCASRRHISDDHGHALRQVFRAQPVSRMPPETGPQPAGLEPDEAQIVYENYRRSLAAKGAPAPKGGKSGIILVEDEEDARKKAEATP